MPALLRKYGASGIVVFPVLSVSGATFASGVTFAASDVRVSKDEAAFANATGTPTHVEGGVWKWAYTASQATCKRLTIKVKDQTASRAFEPVVILVETYGNASAQHKYDLGATGSKTGYALVTGQHDSIGTRVWATTARTLTSGLVVWSVAARTLTSAGVAWTAGTRTLTSGSIVWSAATRTLSAFSFTVSVGAIASAAKTGYSLVTGQHDAIGARAWAQTTRTLTSAGVVWSAGTRTLTSGASLACSVWNKTITDVTGAPAANPAAKNAVSWVYVGARYKRLTTATGDKFHSSASVGIAKAPVSASSTVFTRGKYTTVTG